jgi:hypothetical protein
MHGGSIVIALDRLASLAAGEDDDETEEHVLSCGSCAEQLASLVRLGPAIAELVRAGRTGFVATRALVDRLEAERLISRRYALAPGSTLPCAVAADDIFSLITFEVDLTGATRVDLTRNETRYLDVPFDPTSGRLYLVTPSEVIRRLPSGRLDFLIRDGDRTLGEYALDHTAFAPGS